MMLKCTDKVPDTKIQRQKPQVCLKRGIGIGKNLKVKITEDIPKDVLREIARQHKIRGRSNMSKQELYEALLENGVTHFKPFDLYFGISNLTLLVCLRRQLRCLLRTAFGAYYAVKLHLVY